MKKNTQKILLALYSQGKQINNRVPIGNMEVVVPTLTGGGFRSLLHVLKKQDLITTTKVLGETTISITNHGMVLLEREFPALSKKWDEWQGDWECLIFLEAPTFDKQFRYLRNLLITEGSLGVSRGVYISPGRFSDVVLTECQNSYHNAVIIFSVAEWKIANDTSFLIDKYGLLDLVETYSGISSDVDRLIKLHDGKKRLIDRYKTDISLVYDRVCEVLSEDPGFCSFYFSEAPKVKELLFSINTLISR